MPAEQVREAWGRYAPAFAAEGAEAEQRDSIRRLVQLCDLESGASVLDVGTGAGYTAFVFARTGVRPVALDPTHEMLLAVRSGWRERELGDRARVVESWAERLPFAGSSFDAVVCHRAAHQFADAQAFAVEAARVLHPGGALGLADQSPPDGWEEWHNTLERERDPTHEHARSPGQWRQVMEAAGLEVVRSDVVYQSHVLADWLDRVSCPPERAERVRQMFAEIPEEIRDVYRPDGTSFRTPQAVLVARVS